MRQPYIENKSMLCCDTMRDFSSIALPAARVVCWELYMHSKCVTCLICGDVAVEHLTQTANTRSRSQKVLLRLYSLLWQCIRKYCVYVNKWGSSELTLAYPGEPRSGCLERELCNATRLVLCTMRAILLIIMWECKVRGNQ